MNTCKKNSKVKATRKQISLDMKMQVIKRLEAGERQVDIGARFDLHTATIRTILKNKAKILSSARLLSPFSAKRMIRSRSAAFEEMEKELSIWITDKTQLNVPLNKAAISEKAKIIFDRIQKQKGNTNGYFVASKKWFEKFMERHDFYNNEVAVEVNSDTKIVSSSALINVTDKPETPGKTEEAIKQENIYFENEEYKELSTDFLVHNLSAITEVMDEFIANDPNFERSSRARENVMEALSCYRELLEERERKLQITINNLNNKTPKILIRSLGEEVQRSILM